MNKVTPIEIQNSTKSLSYVIILGAETPVPRTPYVFPDIIPKTPRLKINTPNIT